MRFLRAFFFAVILLGGVFLIGGLLIPSEWSVSRSTVINASAEKIYPFVANFKKWEKWSPWSTSKQPTIKYTYSGPKKGVGAKQSWTSDKMGKGWMKLTSAEPNEGVEYDLFIDMGNSQQSTLHGHIAFFPDGDSTKVTWTDKGNSGDNYLKRWMSLLIKVMIGRDIDAGLSNLKAVVEKTD